MSDDIFDGDEEATEGESGPRKGGLLSGLAIQILKWTAIVLGAIIFVVTVVVITLNILQGDEGTGAPPPSSEEYSAQMPSYDYYGGIGEIRGNTVEGESTFIVEIQLGYEEEDTRTQSALSNRTPRIRDYVRNFFATKTTEELSPNNEDELKTKMLDDINRLIGDGTVREVIFDEYQVVPF